MYGKSRRILASQAIKSVQALHGIGKLQLLQNSVDVKNTIAQRIIASQSCLLFFSGQR